MANLRILSDNAVDRALTLTASTTAGTLAASNMALDLKSQVWRSTGTSATITLTWTNAETIGVVAIPYCSFSPTATIRVRGYTTVSGTLAVDTGTITASPNSPGVNLGVNSYAYGGGTSCYVYLTPTAVRQVVIDIVDTSNALGYIEVSRLTMGSYWEALINPVYGSIVATNNETSVQERSDAGDLRTDRGVMFKTLSFQLPYMDTNDRDTVWKFLRSNGMYKPMFVSLTPASTDGLEEQIHTIYGKLTKASALTYQMMHQMSTTIEIGEI